MPNRAPNRPRPLIAGNWKMNGRRAGGVSLAAEIVRRALAASPGPRCEVLICPPAILLLPVGEVLAGGPVRLGAQDCHFEPDGAHTGDVSAAMLAGCGCRYVILGHSERRANHGETDAIVRAKTAAAHKAGLTAVVCIGETEAERERGETLSVVARQLAGSLPEGAAAVNTVIAYEPVWAIGSGRTPTLEEVAEVHADLRRELATQLPDADQVRLLYGGSVKPGNAAALLSVAEVDGALVGGASLKADDFWGIVAACP